MSTPPRFLEELLDHVVDNLHYERENLENCCLVSKSWIPRARKHLFSTISIRDTGNLQSWKNAFPDPSSSPACYAKTLAIGCPEVVATGDAEEGGWLSAFSRVVRLAMYIPSMDRQVISLVPFHGFSPFIRSLRIHLTTFPSSPIFNLICSFSPLENLHVEVRKGLDDPVDNFDGQQPPVQTQNPPAFTGSLKFEGIGLWSPLVRPLLSLPSGLHFQSLCLTLIDKKIISLATALVERCRSTLESLELDCVYTRMFILHCFHPNDLLLSVEESFPGSIELSKAKNIKRVSFSVSQNPQWIIPTLRTVTPAHMKFRRMSLNISFHFLDLDDDSVDTMDSAGFKNVIGKAACRGWSELDLLLGQLWESHSIRPEVTYTVYPWVDLTRAGSWVESLLPEVSTRGIVNLIGKQRRRTIQKPRFMMVFDRFLREEWGGRVF